MNLPHIMNLFLIKFLTFANLFILINATTRLTVNVKSENGEIFQETIAANSSDDWVSLEYRQPDFTHVNHLIDFKQELQIIHIVRLGEEELGQKPHQEMCFVAKFEKDDYISSDAMSKLRQKNPWTVRTPEEDRGSDYLDVDLSLDVNAVGSLLSPQIPILCSSAQTMTFASSRDLKSWVNDRQDVDSDWASLTDASHQQPSKGVAVCSGDLGSAAAQQQPCVCRQQVCLWWYPCGLKYCKDKDDTGKTTSYRCGIKTCRKCRFYGFYTPNRSNCLQ